MKKDIQKILDKTNDSKIIFEEVNEVVKTYKRLKRGRKTYDLPKDISLLQISDSLEVPGMSSRALYNKLRNDKKKGFAVRNENKEITKALISFVGKTRKELIVDFPN